MQYEKSKREKETQKILNIARIYKFEMNRTTFSLSAKQGKPYLSIHSDLSTNLISTHNIRNAISRLDFSS